VNSKDKDGWTPLMFALRYNQAENARLLIEKGASLEDRNP
jgi:ankyrin repeat protein